MEKRFKKLIALLTISVMILSLAACSKEESKESTTPSASTPAPTQETKEETKPTEEITEAPEENEGEENGNEEKGNEGEEGNGTENPEGNEGQEENPEGNEGNEGQEEGQKTATGLKMSVNGADGKMSIVRPEKKSTPMGEENTWTIFVYLCGTDLESSGQGSASSDVDQMLAATGSDNVKFVFQTGGTSAWNKEEFSTEKAQRFVVQNQTMTNVEELELNSMGNPDTFADFLKWGVQNYPAAKMGVVFWNHGGGSITGACFDELNESDSLSLQEINTALASVYETMTDQFEFIGFDCCLMGTAETANIVASYARYFYGSQECEPGSGWDYTTYGTAMAENPAITGAELGQVITDSFYAECEAGGQAEGATLTVIDLSKYDDFVVAFNDYAKNLYEAGEKNMPGIVRGITSAESFGGNNKAEGYTNMVDLGSIIEKCSEFADGSAVLEAMKNCIVYNKNGSNHTNASGISVYYPLHVEGSSELKIFAGVCISPYYLSLVDRVAKGFTEGGYTNTVFFNAEGNWENNDGKVENVEDSYFEEQAEEGEESKESKLITFETEPAFDAENGFGFKLEEKAFEYTADVSATIYLAAEEESYIAIGETLEINADWETGTFYDAFDGSWLALPDGQTLSTYIVSKDENSSVYTSPVLVNGKRTNLRIRQDENGVAIEGVWDGIGENGVPSRNIRDLAAGDVVVPLYYFSDKEETSQGNEYTFGEDDQLTYAELPAGDYYYGFDITDVYGDKLTTEFAMFSIDEEGQITFGDGAEGEEGTEGTEESEENVEE